MTLLRLAVATLLIAVITLCRADRTSFHLPDGFNASVLTQVRIDQNIEADSELRSRFDFYRLYLSVEPPGWGAGPICWLAFLTRLDDQLINITIPADVVPDKTRVRLSTSLIHKGTGRNNGWDYSHRVTCLKDFNPPKAAGVMASVPLVSMLVLSAAAVLAQYL
ncbi:hypothetical protein B0T11DRAFT_327773 [Plectosphaerella cucumerina]|uniref:Uncharacterized protein n=1 Tax=Plectosphaerella cucumerina TaxID=40658 RepID=A0A8K0TBG2_9PEZI|nr:hypothetical protein B0T11DRAFT_327773 [Plectosphaerella cucumerina]